MNVTSHHERQHIENRRRRVQAFLCLIAGAALLLVAAVLAVDVRPAVAQGGEQSTPAASPQAGAPPTGDDSYCLICHSDTGMHLTLADGADISLAVDPEMIAASSHGASSASGPLGCVDCHGDYAYPHPSPLPADLRGFRVQMSALCVSCHQEQRSVPEHPNVFHGVHHEELLLNDLNAPTCVDCHSAHDVQPPDQVLDEISPRCGSCHEPEQDLCGACHEELLVEWNSGVHSVAYTRDSFQAQWALRGQPEDCLTCHTTGFHIVTGTYVDANVTCTACHGHYAAGHPPAGQVVAPEPQMCGDCHLSTFEEWTNSPHAFTEDMGPIGCAVCHSPHAQQIRFEDISGLCLNCHQEPLSDYAHASHLERQDMSCGDCHMFSTPDPDPELRTVALVPEDHAIANHLMRVETQACNACHEDLDRRLASFAELTNTDELLQQRDDLLGQVADLQTQIAERQTPPSEPDPTFVQLTQGLIIGLGVSLTIALVLLRRSVPKKNGSAPPPPREGEDTGETESPPPDEKPGEE